MLMVCRMLSGWSMLTLVLVTKAMGSMAELANSAVLCQDRIDKDTVDNCYQLLERLLVYRFPVDKHFLLHHRLLPKATHP